RRPRHKRLLYSYSPLFFLDLLRDEDGSFLAAFGATPGNRARTASCPIFSAQARGVAHGSASPSTGAALPNPTEASEIGTAIQLGVPRVQPGNMVPERQGRTQYPKPSRVIARPVDTFERHPHNLRISTACPELQEFLDH